MAARILISLGVLIYAVVVPCLVINGTHVWNPDWPAHARLHEVWQLTTNAAIGVLSLGLAWLRGQVRLAGLLNLVVMGGVLFAHAIEDVYGGSLRSDNVTRTLLGMELAAVAAGSVVLMSIAALILSGRHGRAAVATES